MKCSLITHGILGSVFIDKMSSALFKWLLLIVLDMFFVVGCFSDDPVEMHHALENVDGGDAGGGFETDGDTIPNPEGCNPRHEPTWENPVDKMMQAQCTKCHEETATYTSIQPWVDNGLLKQYCEMGAGHFLTSGKEYCLRWIAVGAPETPCDVITTK